MSEKAHKRTFAKKEPKEFEEEVIQIDRVTRVVKGGRKLRFRATVAIGNKKGKVGIGLGKSHEVTGAIQKAIAVAKKNMITVKLHGTTIPHDTKIKYKSARLLLIPAGPGTGIIAGGTVRKVLELAGVKDILSKSLGTTNKVNNTKVTFEALKGLRETPLMKREAEKNKLLAAKPATPAQNTKPVEAKSAEATKPADATKVDRKEHPAKKSESKQ